MYRRFHTASYQISLHTKLWSPSPRAPAVGLMQETLQRRAPSRGARATAPTMRIDPFECSPSLCDGVWFSFIRENALTKSLVSAPVVFDERRWFHPAWSAWQWIVQTFRGSQSRCPAGEIADDSAHCRIPSGSAFGIGRSRERSWSVQHPRLCRAVRKTDSAPSLRYGPETWN